ncbi:MAG: hypothetical protein FD123_1009 [Bacteroidetes bacterium]|nr:MAG: hypothetical protein FD123_1009 [Bacteroidota bacterium]
MKSALYLIAASTLFFSTAEAGNYCDSTKTKKIHIGNDEGFKHWQGLDIGFSGWLTRDNSIDLPEAWRDMEIDNARSFAFAWNMHQHNFHLYKNYINVGTGLGLEWNSYAFRENITLGINTPRLTATLDSINYAKNKLRTCFVNVPVMLDFNTSEDEDRAFHLSAGVKFGYNVFRNRQVQKFYENDGDDKEKRVIKDDYYVNPFRYSLMARVGYGDYTLFADYALSEMFRSAKGPQVTPFTVGLHIAL